MLQMLKQPMGAIWFLLKETFRRWERDRAPRPGAALSYCMIISLPPLLMVVIGITGLFLDEAAGRGAILEQVSHVVGEKSASAIREIRPTADAVPLTKETRPGGNMERKKPRATGS